jgi:hypothetical protein
MSENELTGTKDKNYNLISVLYHAMENAQTFQTYVQDAEQEGDHDLADFFRELLTADQQLIQRGKQLLSQRMTS